MPKYAVQPQWRSRRAAIGKKCEIDYTLLMESELDLTVKELVKVPSSPLSITVDFVPTVPEMKPLPGAWVTVGKGGRPVKVSLMYNEPAQLEGKKKKKRVRARKSPTSEYDAEAEALVILEEAASSSKCLQALDRSTMQREKAALKGKNVKYWQGYNAAKALKVHARDTLIAALAGSMLGESEAGVEVLRESESLKICNDKGSSRKAMLRRKARFAAAAVRCYSVERGEEETTVVEVEVQTKATPLSSVNKAAKGWVRLAKAVAETESGTPTEVGESEVSSTDMETLPAKRDSKQCIVA